MAAAHQAAVKAAVVAKVMPVVETVDSVAVAKVVERVEAAVAMEMPAVAKVATAVEGEDSVVAVKVAVDSSSGSVVVMVPSILVVCSAAAAHPVAAMATMVVETEGTSAKTCSRFARILIRPQTGARRQPLAAPTLASTRPDNRMSRRQTDLSGPLQLQVDTLPMYRACLRRLRT